MDDRQVHQCAALYHHLVDIYSKAHDSVVDLETSHLHRSFLQLPRNIQAMVPARSSHSVQPHLHIFSELCQISYRTIVLNLDFKCTREDVILAPE